MYLLPGDFARPEAAVGAWAIFWPMSVPEAAPTQGAPRHRPHFRFGFPGIPLFVLAFFRELVFNLPAMLALRFRHRRALRAAARTEPWVACIGDNLDEVNGIALASRIQLRELRRQGHKAFLFGVAFHTRAPRRDGPEGSVVLAPGRISIDQAGYAQSELVVVRLRAFLDFLRENPVDVAEFETPGPVSALCMIAARVAGVRTLSHYRTDIIVYSDVLMKGRLGKFGVQWWTRMFTRLCGPVVVPSSSYGDKVAAMGVPRDRIHKLPRGVDLEFFRPDLRDAGIWARFGIPEDGFKLLFVGRVSLEKNLAVLCDAFLEALARRPDLRLVVVGDGPYLETMRERLRSCGRAHFTGVLRDGTLARVFASADLFVFPSLADTFGNSVVEALASGLPCLVSDEGGPREIVEPERCGRVFAHRVPGALRDGILDLASDPARLASWSTAARARALTFSYDAAANAFWQLYKEVWKSGQ